ncbi:MAG: hypothetical protein QG635_619 [Bacteroidota bacterium]|nr:hypothetical protein [Bacteroidota bacterium]
MELKIEQPYMDKINKIIDKGFADTPAEAVRQSILFYVNQLEFEELFLVDKAVEAELFEINSGKMKTYSVDDVFNMAGI